MTSSTPTFMPIIVDVLFVLIAGIFIAVGAKRGFIKSLIQSAKFLLAFGITYFVGPMAGQFVKDRFVFQPVYNWLTDKGVGAAEKLPDFLRPDPATVGEGVLPFAESVATIISNLVGYVVVFVVSLILLTIVGWLLTKIADKIALLGVANRILGGVFGAVMGVVVLFIIACIIKFLDAKDAIYSQTVIVEFLGNLLA